MNTKVFVRKQYRLGSGILYALSIGLFILSGTPLHAASTLTQTAKKAPTQKVAAHTPKQSVQKQKKASKKISLRETNKEKGRAAKSSARSRKIAGKKQVRALAKQHVPVTRSGADEAVYRKQKASINGKNQLAQTLRKNLGVEVLVQDDPSHSGGLFIAPPSAGNGSDTANKALDLMANLPLGKPIDSSVSSGFGGRQDPLNSRKAFHEGLDFKGRVGDRVSATGKGKVVSSSYSPDYGEHVIISHGNGYETMYAHLSKRRVEVGETVNAGRCIGLVGNSGRSTGAHLHYEIRYQGAPVNPMQYVQVIQPSLKFSNK